MDFCAHLGFQFTEYDGMERVRQAAQAGFRAVEWPAIYGFDAEELAGRVRELGLEWAQVTLPLGDASKGEKGSTALPGREQDFELGLQQAIRYAKALGSHMIHPMAGVGVSLSDPKVMATYLNNLVRALQVAQAQGLRVIIEVINEETVPGYAMCTYELAEHVLDRMPDLLLLVDTYHAQTLTGDPSGLVSRWKGRIGHVQIADAPGRHEPGTGQIDFQTFLGALRAAGYEGWLGCEYKPKEHTLMGLSYLEALCPHLRAAHS